MHPCNSDAQITHLPLLYYPKQILFRSFPPSMYTNKNRCDENVAISGMYRLKGNVMKM